jgi:hypothetical protein
MIERSAGDATVVLKRNSPTDIGFGLPSPKALGVRKEGLFGGFGI